MESRRQTKVKYTVHRKVPSFIENSSNGSFPKVIRISVSDPDATDSSSDEENDNYKLAPKTRVKRQVQEIRFCDEYEAAKRVKTTKAVDEGVESTQPVKYRGVRQRPWGKFAAEIRDPSTGNRIWIGTFATAKEAALGYDRAAIRLKGHNAQTNLLTPPPSPSSVPETPVNDLETVSGCDSARDSQTILCSPTSVLRFSRNEETEPVKQSSSESKDPFFLPDLFQTGFNFWDSEIAPEPLFLDEVQSLPNFNTVSEKDPNFLEGFPLSEIGDFSSCSWDVDEFFQDNLLD